MWRYVTLRATTVNAFNHIKTFPLLIHCSSVSNNKRCSQSRSHQLSKTAPANRPQMIRKTNNEPILSKTHYGQTLLWSKIILSMLHHSKPAYTAERYSFFFPPRHPSFQLSGFCRATLKASFHSCVFFFCRVTETNRTERCCLAELILKSSAVLRGEARLASTFSPVIGGDGRLLWPSRWLWNT